MTADRQDGTPSRRRASQTRKAFDRAFAVPTRPAVPPALADESAEPATPPASVPEQGQGTAKPVLSKYTALLDADTATEFDGLALAARRKLGRKVDKSALMRALIRLAADDASLRDQVINEVGKG